MASPPLKRISIQGYRAARELEFEPGSLVVLPVPELELVEVDELPSSERGVRGFGSSKTG